MVNNREVEYRPVINLRYLKWGIPLGILLWALILWPVFGAGH